MAAIQIHNTTQWQQRISYGTTDVDQLSTVPVFLTETQRPTPDLHAPIGPVSQVKMDTNSSLEKKESPREEQLQSLLHPDKVVPGNEVHRLEEKPRFDPRERLPEELWLTVLKEALTTEICGVYSVSTEMALSLINVSTKWLHSITWAPLLWTDIVLDDQMDDLAMNVAICLHLSRAAPLTVLLVGPMRCWHSIEPIIAKHKERIRRMWLIGAHNGAGEIPSTSALRLEYVNQPSPQTLNTLLMRLPYLVSLKLSVAYDFLSQTMASMEHLRNLYDLDITIRSIPTEEFIPPIITDPLKTVQKLRFSNGWLVLDQDHLRMLSKVPGSFFSLMPNVKFFEIESYMSPMIHDLTSVSGFENLRTLVLDIRGERNSVLSQQSSMLPSTVSTLTINGWDPRAPNGFFATAVTNLRVSVFDPRNSSSGRHRDNHWPSIQKLHASHIQGPLHAHDPHAPADWESFSSLTTLHIDGYTHSSTYSSEADDVTEICIFIAIWPDTCPALSTLSFGRFPDLDILFIMLERRNQRRDQHSSSTGARIRRLRLPTPVSQPNFKTIRDLLRGSIVERQSNQDASMHRKKRMLDKPDV
jgi:hypothetical protein